jgi:NitT/TauT family transport system substrate-binding protein
MKFISIAGAFAVALSLGGSTVGAEPALQTVRITNIGTDYWAGALYVAQSQKLFEKHGLTPEVTAVKGGSLALQTVLTKEADVALLSYEHILTGASKGQRVVAVYRLVSRPINNVVVKNDIANAAAKLNLAGKVQKLKGLRIGVPSAGGSGEEILHVLASKYGLKLGDFTTVYLGSDPGSYLAAFQHDQIDAALPVEPAGALVEQAGLGKTMINLMAGDVPEFDNLIYMNVAMNADAIKANPDFAKRVAATFGDAMKILKNNPTLGVKLMQAQFPQLAPPTNQRAYSVSRDAWTSNGKMSVDEAKRVSAYMTSNGGLELPANFDYASTFTNDFAP